MWYTIGMKARSLAGGLAGLLLAAGCATTPESRIRARPELFASFPAETQERIRAGGVAIGFTEDMVRMALGEPDQVLRRETAGGTATIWSYTDSRPVTRYDYIPVTSAARDSRGRLRTYPDWVMADRTIWLDVERLRVEFKDGRVTAMESALPR